NATPISSTQNAGGQNTAAGKIDVAAHGTAAIHLVVSFNTIGTAQCTLSVGDANKGNAGADAERRLIPVYPDGRPFETALNGNGKDIKLPAGFFASDLQLSMMRSDPSQCLDGLGYLVEYPYGCVEQTMSRFLPAVMVKNATQQGVTLLPDETLKR